MKPDIIHSVAVCLTAVMLPFMAACDGREASFVEEATETALCLNIEQIGLTRSGVADLTDNEKMHSVRIVILHPDGTVEHNRHYSLEGVLTRKYIVLKVKSNEKKKVFIFANEESVSAVEGVTAGGSNPSLTGFFDSYPEGTDGFETEVNKLYFAPGYYTAADGSFLPIPMSSMYEIEVPKNENFNGTFYVVRVATKFVVKFFNWRGDNVLVDFVGLESHAVKNFLMAHVGKSQQQPFDYPTWIDWLKAVSEASNTTDWLTDYELPVGETSGETYQSSPIDVPTYPGNGAEPPTHVFYLPESKHLKADATNGEQAYTMKIQITDVNAGIFECPLTKLNALFRNTEVVVNVELLLHSIKVDIDVIPYSSVSLDPVFGL